MAGIDDGETSMAMAEKKFQRRAVSAIPYASAECYILPLKARSKVSCFF
jgi:hypothetical protein